MRSWSAIDVKVTTIAEEAVEHAFNMLGSLGTEISDLKQGKSGHVCVAGYFDRPPDEGYVRSVLADALHIYGLDDRAIISMAVRTVPETDWLAEWKKHWRPTEIGRFVITPPWADLQQKDKIVIRIEPNMAFGTGTHETTQLCLRAIDEHFHEGMSMLDVGTGTGILAIAAAKLSPSSPITACDVDEDAVKIARENAEANGGGGSIKFLEGPIDEGTPAADLVCANLTLDVITPLLPMLLDKSLQYLLLSGILAEQEAAIRQELFKLGISKLKLTCAGEWLSVLVRNY